MNDAQLSIVTLDARGISIRGTRQMILCASLFYFRIPEGNWRDRMQKIRSAGYNCIDVYFPWNFHETAKDVWDFESGMRDVAAFLALAAEYDLYVMARPGPYICSEWDGGALPAYLFADGLRIRQNDAAYLERVEEWYRRIMPIIGRHQIDRGGSVIMVQVENELDFFGCDDVPGYIAALGESAVRNGISVPLIACAGQGDIYGAWGKVDSIIPTMNLYMDSRLPGLERGVLEYTQILSEFDVPLMVTEMGRDNLLMRRYVASGAKLLGPYNQVSGFDFGFTNSVNNWGDPTSFQTSYYDFSSLVTPYGEIRDFVGADRVLSGLFRSLGPLLAAAVPLSNDRATDDRYLLVTPSGEEMPPVLDLGGEARMIAVSNLSEAEETLALRGPGLDEEIRLPAYVSAFILRDIDLESLGVPVRVVCSTAEPVVLEGGEHPIIVWQAPVSAVVRVVAGQTPIELSLSAGSVTRTEAVLSDGRTLTMIGVGRELAGTIAGVESGELSFIDQQRPVSGSPLELSFAVTGATNESVFSGSPSVRPSPDALALEKNGVLRGYGLYRAEGMIDAPVAIVLHDAGDVVSLSRGGIHLGTLFPSGVHEVIPMPTELASDRARYEIRAEIWGHSNFDDSRKPNIRISSLRGISGVTEVREIVQLPLWQSASPAGGDIPYLSSFGSHLTTDRPSETVWRTTFPTTLTDDSVLLSFDGILCDAEVAVNGLPVGRADTLSPVLDVTAAVVPGQITEVVVTLTKRHFQESAGRPRVLLGTRLRAFELFGAGEDELAIAGLRAREASEPTELPIVLRPGEMEWLHLLGPTDGPYPDLKLEVSGVNCKATALYNGVVCGRLFLETEGGPAMRPGNPNLGFLPGCWSEKEENRISILLEAVGREDARVDSVTMTPIA